MVKKVSRIPKELLPEGHNCENKGKLLRFSLGNHEGRDSTTGAEIHIWVGGAPKPARLRLIRGKAELLSGMDIVKQLGPTVNFWGNQFKVGQSEWGMMNFEEKHRCVFALVPTDCDYDEANGYFWEIEGR